MILLPIMEEPIYSDRRSSSAAAPLLAALLLPLLSLVLSTTACISSAPRQQELARLQQELAKAQGELQSARQELARQKEGSRERERERERRIIEIDRERIELIQSGREKDRQLQEYAALLAQFDRYISNKRIRVRLTDGRLVVILPSDLLFASASARISSQERETIEEIAKILMGVPDLHFQIDGHTDNIPIQTPQFLSNWELAAERALNILHTMIEVGMPPQRLSAASYGNTRPVNSNDSPEGRALNRRIEISLIPDLSIFRRESSASGNPSGGAAPASLPRREAARRGALPTRRGAPAAGTSFFYRPLRLADQRDSPAAYRQR